MTVPTSQSATFFRFLDATGDGTGSKELSVNGSVTPVVFRLTAPNRMDIHRIMVYVRDGTGFKATTFGVLAGLTNGCLLKKHNAAGDVELDLLDTHAIKDNSDWGRFCYDVDVKSWGGATPTDDSLVARWTLARAGLPLILRTGESLRLTVRDDLTGLTEFHIMAQGVNFGAEQ